MIKKDFLKKSNTIGAYKVERQSPYVTFTDSW